MAGTADGCSVQKDLTGLQPFSYPSNMAQDMRSLPRNQQDALRLKAVNAVAKGQTQSEVARVLGVARASINTWMATYRQQGEAALSARPRGRPPSGLGRRNSVTVLRSILTRCPDELGFSAPLWTWEAVQRIFAQHSGEAASRWTINRYLVAWGFRTSDPLARAAQQEPERARRSLHGSYAEIWRAARREGAALYWIERQPLSLKVAGPRLRRAVSGERNAFVALIGVKARGEQAFAVYPAASGGEALVEFLQRLLRHAGGPVFAIVDRSVWHSPEVRDWVRSATGPGGGCLVTLYKQEVLSGSRAAVDLDNGGQNE
ncbi:MAG: helix-turn-helix domain-containing protein [Thermoanaerobaculia bacterium]